MLVIILIVLLLLSGGFGLSSYNTYGGYGYSPLGLIVIALIVWLLFFRR